MSNYTFTFNAAEHNPEMTAPQLPAGMYDLAVTGTDIVENAEKGYGLVVTFTVMNGEYAGRKIVDRLCTIGYTDKVQAERGNSRLSAICHATGRMQVSGQTKCSELIGGQCKAEVKNDGKYSNITTYFDMMGNKPGQDGNRASVATPVAVAVPQQAPAPQYSFNAAPPVQQPPIQNFTPPATAQAPVAADQWNSAPTQQPQQFAPNVAPVQAWQPPAA